MPEARPHERGSHPVQFHQDQPAAEIRFGGLLIHWVSSSVYQRGGRVECMERGGVSGHTWEHQGWEGGGGG